MPQYTINSNSVLSPCVDRRTLTLLIAFWSYLIRFKAYADTSSNADGQPILCNDSFLAENHYVSRGLTQVICISYALLGLRALFDASNSRAAQCQTVTDVCCGVAHVWSWFLTFRLILMNCQDAQGNLVPSDTPGANLSLSGKPLDMCAFTQIFFILPMCCTEVQSLVIQATVLFLIICTTFRSMYKTEKDLAEAVMDAQQALLTQDEMDEAAGNVANTARQGLTVFRPLAAQRAAAGGSQQSTRCSYSYD